TKFKAQKKEALRKLENTEQNLLRVADLIREVKRQIGSLQRQAGEARRYKQLLLALRQLETQLAGHQFDVIHSEIRTKQGSIEQHQHEIERVSEGLLQSESEIVQLRVLLSEIEREISQTQRQAHELQVQSERHEGLIRFNQERLLE